MSSLPKGIFITGTDTGVGKTVVTAAIAWCLKRSGKDVAVMKPVQTGTELDVLTDIEFVQSVIGEKYSIQDVCPYRFKKPLAPLVASRLENRTIDIDKIISAYRSLVSAYEVVIVEGAGGLLVPINSDYLMSDLAEDLGTHLIVVARPGLGTLNHTVLTVKAAQSRGLSVLGVVISDFPSDPGDAERTNPGLMSEMTGVPILGVLPTDPMLCVESGNPGNLRETAVNSLSELLGGNFLLSEFHLALNI